MRKSRPEYRERGRELMGIDFWKGYLNLEEKGGKTNEDHSKCEGFI